MWLVLSLGDKKRQLATAACFIRSMYVCMMSAGRQGKALKGENPKLF